VQGHFRTQTKEVAEKVPRYIEQQGMALSHRYRSTIYISTWRGAMPRENLLRNI
jgi:hypothetical protein